ncbi:MAG: carboxylesterase family protein [Clostridia bacterium]|nr:carboxylesterase family protein [Clostridia bacterium]
MIRKVKTENGWVKGLPAADPRITSYKGIPFAAPPVGENRWRAPQPCPDWEGEFEAYAFSPIPMQAPISADPKNLYDREWHVDREIPMGEDCLTLNIWAPADARKDMPVLVWYFGGGLQVGYSAEMEFDGERIARRGIVVVTVNYRVNVFGFLCHPEITKESPDAPANFGFLDQQAATRWVKRNIAAFGGDPDNITVGGQSAGGMSVSAQITCPENRGLIRRAIIQSGSFAPPYPSRFGLTFTMREAEEIGKRFFDFLGVKSLAEARRIDAVTLRDKALAFDRVSGLHIAFGEALDGVFSFRNSQEWFMDENRLPIPVLLGHTSGEFAVFPNAKDEESLKAFAREAFGEDAEAFLSFFTHPASEGSIRREGNINAIEFAVRAAARYQEARGENLPLYYYQFDPEIPGWDNPGTFHSVDLWFFFETLAKCWRPFKGKHYDLARQMCDYWCNFIKTGDPNGADSQGETLPAWPRFETSREIRMNFGDTAAPQYCPANDLKKFLVEKYLKGQTSE